MPAGQAPEPGRGRHPGVHCGHRVGPQRHRLRHPGRRHRCGLVHRSGRYGRRALPRRLRTQPTPTPTSATQPSPRRSGWAGSPWPAAPAIVRFVGGTVADAMRTTREMYEITLAENPAYSLPVLDFRGAADRHRRDPGRAHRHPAPDQHRHRRPASPAPDRSGPASSPRPWSASSPPSKAWPPPPPPPNAPLLTDDPGLRGWGGEEPADGGGRVTQVLVHGPGQVSLVGEAEVGGERGETGFPTLQPVQGPPEANPVAVAGQ